MLISLSVKNYALIADVEIVFGRGLNILTGETGAGKSILLSALGIILGDRVDTTVLRADAEKAVVEGTFNIRNNLELQEYLQQQDLDTEHDEIILRRELYQTSRTRAFVNDSPVQINILQHIGNFLVDLHGQHEHQSLLKVANHLSFLDEFGELESDVSVVRKSYRELTALIKKREEIEERQRNARDKRDFLTFQISEIDKVNLQTGEEEQLLREEKLLQHSERLFSITNELYQILYENENSVIEQLSRVRNGLSELQTIDEQFTIANTDFEACGVAVEELAKFLQSYNSRIDFSHQRLEEIQNRLAEITSLKKRHSRQADEILAFRDDLKRELDALTTLDHDLEVIEQSVFQAEKRFSQLCANLSEKRKKTAKKLEILLPDVLSYLGMPKSRFKVELQYQEDAKGLVNLSDKRYRASDIGIDIANILLSTNVGEEIKPLSKVASGGEISRIMLALKSVLAKEGRIPVLIFDEIDIGVSGRIARAVGRKLRQLSEHHQVICITHLPQIASMGTQHYLVEKTERAGRIETEIRKLDDMERTEAIAKLLAGDKVSEAHLNSAKELLQDAAQVN